MINIIQRVLTPAIMLACAPYAPSAQAASLQATVSGLQVSLDTSRGIRLLALGKGVKSSEGRVFGVMIGERRVFSDEVAVREAKATASTVKIAFDLPEGLGSGVLNLTPSKEPGVINAGLELTSGISADWRFLFPLLEKMKLDAAPAEKIEFFFPMQEGWIGRGEYDLSVSYGFRAWLPVLAAWNPSGTGIALQSRDSTFTYRSLRFRNTSPGKAAPAYYPDSLDMASAFPMDSTGISLSVCPIGTRLDRGQTWKSATAAIQVYDGKGLFKTPFKSYEKWARATWWKHRKTPDWLRDSFMSFAVHERVGNAGFSRGLHDGKQFICGEQAEAYNAKTGGHAFAEWCHWWNHGEMMTSGPYAGRLHPLVGEGEYRLEDRWGGLPAYRAEVERCHKAGARICLYFLGGSVWKTSPVGREHAQDWGVKRTPGGAVEQVWSAREDVDNPNAGFWDICSEVPGWQEFLRDTSYRVLTEIGVDAVRMDTKCEALICKNPSHTHADDPLRGVLNYMRTIREGVDRAGPEKALMGEFAGSDAAAQYFDSTLAQGHDIDTPLVSQMTAYGGISPFRWVFPEMKCIEWGNVPKDYHQTTRRVLFNGIGMTVSDLNMDQLAEMTRFAEAMRSVGDILGSTDCEPLVPTLVTDVYANRFGLKGRQVFTFWNRSKSTVSGKVIRLPGSAGRRFVDLLTGKELKTARSGKADVVYLSLPVNEVAIVGVFPRMITAKKTANSISFTSGSGTRLELYDPMTCKVLSSGSGTLTVARGAGGACVRAVNNGYLVQDCVEVKL